jgi:hypothetical protein
MSKWNHEHTKLWSQQNLFWIFWNKCYGQQKSLSSSSNKYMHQYCKNHIKISKVYIPNFTTFIHKTFKGYKYMSFKIFTLRKKILTFIWCTSKSWFINLNWLHLNNSAKKFHWHQYLQLMKNPRANKWTLCLVRWLMALILDLEYLFVIY